MHYAFSSLLLGGALVFLPQQHKLFRFGPWPGDPLTGLSSRHAPAVRAHSHNDYAQERPLWDALENHFYSVEADVWLQGGQLMISHFGFNLTGSLKALYLDPLQERVRRLGSVYGDSREFLLWVDIKDGSVEMPAKLQELFLKYPMLTRFTDSGIVPGPVTVILTGNAVVKREYTKAYRLRLASHDSRRFNSRDQASGDPGWRWYALNWGDYFDWDGRSPIPDGARNRLRAMVRRIHARGRSIRFWNVPDTAAAWAETYDAGVDLVNTDSLQELAAFLDSKASALIAGTR
jgi:hypothetical protein